MKIIFRTIIESYRLAIQSLRNNPLRTTLSLLGIMIGIFCVIIVKSAVDSFEDSIKGGFSELGSDVIYVSKQPWDEDPSQSYWKYNRRPEPNFKDFESIKEKSKIAEAVAYTCISGGKTIKYKSSNVSGVTIFGSSQDFPKIQSLKISKGRYFSAVEDFSGTNKVILGHAIANSLFGNLQPIGQTVKMLGQKYVVVGVLEEEGENMFNFMNFDELAIVSLNNFRRFINIREEGRVGHLLQAKAKPSYGLPAFKDELAGIIRGSRKLRPIQEENFSLNEISMLNNILDTVFGVINIAGFIIGIFALIVGMFSVANIMFVSVKERTSLIGVKKALGAQRSIILIEFLIEAIVLCLIGGIVGIFFVFLILKLISYVSPLEFYMSAFNLSIGLFASVLVGIISGLLPALQASQLDPVEAIRQ